MNLDAYTIRKIAPRLLVAVIGVNLSIYLCVAAVDITNIIGGGLGALIRGPFLDANTFQNVGIDYQPVGIVGLVGVVGGGAAAGFLTTISLGGIAAAAAGAIPVILLFFLTIMIVAVLIALAILATVVIRYGAIILLTLVSPIAIALVILPGTEKYFRRWWDFFVKTLAVYPIIAAIFAISDVMGSIFLKAQNGGNGTLGLISIFVVVVVVYAPLFMIPFSFKMAGGFLGQIYDFANKNMAGRAQPKLQKWREDENSLYGKKKRSAKLGIAEAGLSPSQIGSNLMSGARGALRPGEDGTGGKFSRLGAFKHGYAKKSSKIAGQAARLAAIEAEEKDKDIKDILGNDDIGLALFEYSKAKKNGKSEAQARAAAATALKHKDPPMYDPNTTNPDYMTNDPEEKRRRAGQQNAALDQITSIHRDYGDKAGMMIGLRQDTRAKTGENALKMRQMLLDATDNGEDQLGMVSSLGDLRKLATEAKRVDKAGMGFTKDITLVEQLKADPANTNVQDEVYENLLLGALEKSSASEIATMHDKGLGTIMGALEKRITDARASGDQAQYETAVAQAANLYDAFQYATPKNMQKLAPMMTNQDLAGGVNPDSGESETLLQTVERMRGKEASHPFFASNRRDYGQSEAERNAGNTGGLGGIPGAGLGG